jgi:hypothetical protein
MSDFSNLNESLRSKFISWRKDFSRRMKKENGETKDAVNLLIKSASGKLLDSEGNENRSRLSDLEKNQIKQQAGDIIKMLGVGSIFMTPGGSVVLALLRMFKIHKHILPSSFKDDDLEE